MGVGERGEWVESGRRQGQGEGGGEGELGGSEVAATHHALVHWLAG